MNLLAPAPVAPHLPTVKASNKRSKPLRVAFIITRGDSVGGASIHVRDFSKALIQAGHDVKVFIGGEGPVTEAYRAAQIPYETVRHFVREVNPVEDVRGLIALRNALRRFKPELISTHTSKAGFLGRIAAFSLGIPAFYTPHCWSFANGFNGASFYLWAERFAQLFGPRIITVSEAERVEGLTKRVAPERRIVTVHNGMPDLPTAAQANPRTSPPRIVMIGRCEKQKDHATLFQALAELTDLRWTLDCIGDGPLRGELELLAESLGLSRRIRFLGYRRDVAEYLSQSQIFVLITHWESFPRSIIEAMRAGLPVIASDVGGTSESVAHGETGYIVPPREVGPLATHLRLLLENPDLRVEFGSAARARYEARFTLSRMIENTLNVWESVLGRSISRSMLGGEDVPIEEPRVR